MFILSLLPIQEFNNLAVGLGKLCTEPFVSLIPLLSQAPKSMHRLATYHVFPRKKWFCY